MATKLLDDTLSSFKKTDLPPELRVYNRFEVAHMLSISPRQISNLVSSGKLGYLRLGERGIRFTEDQVRRYLKEHCTLVSAHSDTLDVVDDG